ncbi:outer membrane protein assembly factor [Chitinophaga costaii]|nr:POTRA domain-containing protein [Chitinophaga costaii]PUZ21267.1 outer membrane protein assembly factor [Chitinophaga costaii]
MKKLFRSSHLLATALCCSVSIGVSAQQKDTATTQPRTDTVPAANNLPAEAPFTYASPQEYEIADISVSGTQYLDKSLLISIAGISPGDKVVLPGDHFAKTIQSLWSQRLFANVAINITKIEGNKIWLEIALTERPRLSEFVFHGVKKTESDEITTKASLRKGSVVTESLKQNTVGVVRKYYAEKGYRNIGVSFEEQADPRQTNSVKLIITISKGEKVHIQNINIVGNEVLSDASLRKKMKGTKEQTHFTLHPDVEHVYVDSSDLKDTYWQDFGFLVPSRTFEELDPWFRFKFFSSSKFNDSKYAEDKDKMLALYNSKGYRDAAIVDDTTYFTRNGNMNVDIRFEEGKKYYFGNIAWKGNTRYPDSLLNVILGIKKGDVYNMELLEKRIGKQLSPEGGADISSLYMDKGYLFFHIDPVETAIRKDTIDFELRMVEGPQATIKEVRIAGNDKTNEHVIRRELRTIPGEKFSRADLMRSQREISALGFFNPEHVEMNPIPHLEDGTVDIDYKVEEKANDQLELSAGWGGYIGLTGTLGVTFNNFSLRNIFNKDTWDPLPSGDGQKLSVRVSSNGKAYRSYNFSFTEPWLGGKHRNQFSVNFYSSYQNPNAYSAAIYGKAISNNAYFKVLGASVSMGKSLKWPDDYFTFIYALNYQQYKLKNYNYFNIPGFDNGTANNFSIKLTLARSSVSQPIFPTSGSSFNLTAQLTPPYSIFNPTKDYRQESLKDQFSFIEYQKYRFNFDWYVPLSKPRSDNKTLVLRLAAKYGIISRYNNRTTLSPFGRFELGGDGLSNFAIYDRDIISQRGYPVYYTSDPKVNPENGQPTGYEGFTVFNKYIMELRYPISLNPSSTIFGLAFLEAANGYRTVEDYNPFRLRRSAGLGMRFYLPMFGLLGFDYGIGFDRLQPGSGLKDAAKFTFMLGFEPE